MTYVFGIAPTELPPLTIWEALKLAEERNAYATITADADPDARIHVFGGRLLAVDQDDRSVDLVRTIAEMLEARQLCSFGPLCDIPDAAELPTLPIAESLVAAVRLKTAAAKLGHDPEKAGDKIVATTFGDAPEHKPQDADADADAAEADADADAGDAEPVDLADERKSEADRMREEFFERRARGFRPGAGKPLAAASLPAPVAPAEGRTTVGQIRNRNGASPVADPNDRAAARPPTTTSRSRRGTDRPTGSQSSSKPSAADQSAERARPTQRTALRSLIRSLVS